MYFCRNSPGRQTTTHSLTSSHEIQLFVSPFASDFALESFAASVTSKKLPNVYKSCPKMISLEHFKILMPLQKLPKNVLDLGKNIVAKGFEKLHKVQ